METENDIRSKEALMSELDAIREQLRSMDHPDRPVGERKDLRKLMEKHNSILNDIHLLEQKPRCDPIERLPEDVAVAVLKEAVVRDSHGSSFISIDLVLFLTSVSLKWRRFIKSTPTLWSDIVLDDQREDLAMKTTISLLLSRHAFLTVQFAGPLRCWDQIESIVLPHSGRIRSIYLEGGWPDKLFQNLSFFTVKPPLDPQLRSIGRGRYIYTTTQGEIVLSGQSEHLHTVTGIPFTEDVLHLPSIRNLKELATDEHANRVLAETLPHLEKVEFLEELQSGKNSMTIPLTMEPLRWTSLTYLQGVIETLTSLLSRSPLLRELSLLITYDDLSQLISSMRNLKSLHRLELTLWNVPKKIFVPPVAIDPLDQVLTFTFMEYSGISSEAEWEKVSQIPNAFFSLIPNVEVLEIESSLNSMVHKLTSAVGFRKVHTLLLELTGNSASQLRDLIISESVRNLTVKFNRAISLIAPGVERLQVVRLELHNASSRYSTVERLHFIHFEGSSNNFHPFVSLTDIFVGGDEAVTRFCLIIAKYPDTCPTLHTLSFGRFPDLDILFLMLERRNLYSPSTQARIRKLEVPARLSMSNFKIVRDLLRGRMVERQSNFEASLQGNIDMFLDPDIPGCLACHKAQVFCSAPTRPGSDTSVPPPPIPPYPAVVEDILNTWGARALAISILSVRSMTCRGKEDLIQVTEDSLECALAPISYSL